MKPDITSSIVGKRALVQFDSIHVLCTILGVRQAYGRIDVNVKPESGKGTQWVSFDRLALVGEQP